MKSCELEDFMRFRDTLEQESKNTGVAHNERAARSFASFFEPASREIESSVQRGVSRVCRWR